MPDTRYIIGHDPVDNDQAESSSLSSTFVLDLWTDKIVAEYTGRQSFAEDNFVVVTVPDTSFTTQPPPKTSCEIVPPDMTTFELPSMSEFAPLPLA